MVQFWFAFVRAFLWTNVFDLSKAANVIHRVCTSMNIETGVFSYVEVATRSISFEVGFASEFDLASAGANFHQLRYAHVEGKLTIG
jgi:hypothetical protein